MANMLELTYFLSKLILSIFFRIIMCRNKLYLIRIIISRAYKQEASGHFVQNKILKYGLFEKSRTISEQKFGKTSENAQRIGPF